MPLFCLHCLDKEEGGVALRTKTRAAHLEWAAGLGEQLRMAGPLLASDGETMVGSVFLIVADSLAAVQGISATDPYVKAGLFAKVDIRETRWSVGAGRPA